MTNKIVTIVGPMKSGKTGEIIRRADRYCLADINVIIFKPDIDSRFSESEIVSRNGKSIKCFSIPVFNLEYIFGFTKKEPQVIIIDEFQFFKPKNKDNDYSEIIGYINKLCSDGNTVICSGLDMDSNGNPYGAMPFVMAISDEVVKLKAVCEKCGDDYAGLTLSRVKKETQDMIGDSEYISLCRNCAKIYNGEG